MLMINNVKKTISAYNMIDKGDKILTAVSGGADSMCLLNVLMMLKEEYCLELAAVHINHQLRGEDSMADERHVREFCKSAGIRCIVKSADVAAIAAGCGWSVEETGRNMRYEILKKICHENGFNKIASAHHRDDLAETVLLNMFRGTGLKGMSGIPPVRGNIIRPLINAGRNEIEDFLSLNNISWRIDKSNYSNDYTRNKIRNNIIPYIESEINKNALNNISKLSKHMEMLYDYVFLESLKAYNEAVIKRAPKELTKIHTDIVNAGVFEYVIDIEKFKEFHTVIRREIIFKAVEECLGSRMNLESTHIMDIEGLMERQSGKEASLPKGINARREFNNIIISKSSSKMSVMEDNSNKRSNDNVMIPGMYMLPWINKYLKLNIIKYNKSDNIPKNSYTKWFDYDKINNAVKLRKRMESDYIKINKDGGHKSIKALYIEKKIEKGLRDKILMLADGNSVLWVPGIRASEGYYIDDDTKHVLTAEIV